MTVHSGILKDDGTSRYRYNELHIYLAFAVVKGLGFRVKGLQALPLILLFKN